MAPNAHQMEKLAAERAERRAIRAEKRRQRDEAERLKAEEKARRTPPEPTFCEGCFSRLSNVEVQKGQDRHSWC
jgi:TPP-dependent indolepyruvate ferredoxin oxidoreductase alpha subunit